jgi:pimeloyl-ACP methyl ester carboxylesterase
MVEWRSERFQSFDGVEIVYRTAGEGRTALMLHGFLASAELNWIGPGIADKVAAAGFRVIAPDLRGHGASDAPVDPAAWPKDVLVDDQQALIARLGLSDYDLVGYSLGARTAARMMVRGARPRRAVLGGMGASGIMEAGARAAMFEDSIRNGENAKDLQAGRRVQFMIRQSGLKPEAMLGVLASFAPTSEADLRGVPTPTLVVCGEADQDNGSPEDLAALLPHGEALRIPGDHLTAVGEPALADAMTGFLTR